MCASGFSSDQIRPKNICVFQVSALKKLGMVGWHNILFCRNILYRNCIFQYIFPNFPTNLTTFCSQLTIKCWGRGKNLGRVRKPETHRFFILGHRSVKLLYFNIRFLTCMVDFATYSPSPNCSAYLTIFCTQT